MVSWTSDGLISGYDPTTHELDSGVYHLATGGSVDLSGITRLQYGAPRVAGSNRIQASAPFTLVAGDFTANPGKELSAALYVAEASNFATGVIPTPSQIVAAPGVQAFRSSVEVASTPAAWTFPIDGPLAPFSPNTKLWCLVLPVAVSHSGVFTPMAGITVDTFGRAVSLWTNRTPAAPTITSPASGSVFAPGATITFAYTPNDPDSSPIPDDADRYNRDLAGVQIQYASLPTDADPTPEWLDLPFDVTISGTPTRSIAWWIRYNDTFMGGITELPPLVTDMGLPIIAGAGDDPGDYDPGNGALPSGDWQLRCRTFDYGQPYPGRTPGSVVGWGTPDAYPSLNTSPWSNPVRVSIPVQVPPPIPLSPISDTAVPTGSTVRLIWQYRNTHLPPRDQVHRTVQIRQVGATDWVTVLDEDSADSFVDVDMSSVPLLATTEYEWRVQVTDTDDLVSNYSTSAKFWVVPAGGSGDLRPIPSETLDGATLGCGKHRVEIYRRGGKVRVGEISGVSYVDWGRKRDDISTSKIVVSDWDIDCGNLLSILQTWAYEVVIFRDNGYSVDRVWEGPITLLTYEADMVTIEAKDVMGYAYRRIIKQLMSDIADGNTVTARAAQVLMNAFAPDDPNVLAYLQTLARDDDAREYRYTPAYSRTAFEEVDDMAANAGLDYTVVGRAILLWGTKHRIGTLPEFRDEDLGSSPIVSEYGMSFANRYVVSDGNGVWGEATRLNSDGEDPTYGLVEMLSSTWASDSTSDTGTYTQAGLAATQQSFADFAERSISDRYPPPVVVRIPDNTTLNPNTVISIQQLVPGVVVPLRSTSTLRTVVANQKLDSLRVVETKDGEAITITLSPFTRDDTATETVDA